MTLAPFALQDRPSAVYLRLEVAMICPDNHLYDVHEGRCPVCGSEHGLPVERALGRV